MRSLVSVIVMSVGILSIEYVLGGEGMPFPEGRSAAAQDLAGPDERVLVPAFPVQIDDFGIELLSLLEVVRLPFGERGSFEEVEVIL